MAVGLLFFLIICLYCLLKQYYSCLLTMQPLLPHLFVSSFNNCFNQPMDLSLHPAKKKCPESLKSNLHPYPTGCLSEIPPKTFFFFQRNPAQKVSRRGFKTPNGVQEILEEMSPQFRKTVFQCSLAQLLPESVQKVALGNVAIDRRLGGEICLADLHVIIHVFVCFCSI